MTPRQFQRARDIQLIRAGWGHPGPENKAMAERLLELLAREETSRQARSFLRLMIQIGEGLNAERGLDKHGKPLDSRKKELAHVQRDDHLDHGN